MCLAVPGEIIEITSPDDAALRSGRVSFGGVVKDVCLAYVPDAQVGSFVLVHAGFAISEVSEEHAREVFRTLTELGEAGAAAESEGGDPGGRLPSAGGREEAP